MNNRSVGRVARWAASAAIALTLASTVAAGNCRYGARSSGFGFSVNTGNVFIGSRFNSYRRATFRRSSFCTPYRLRYRYRPSVFVSPGFVYKAPYGFVSEYRPVAVPGYAAPVESALQPTQTSTAGAASSSTTYREWQQAVVASRPTDGAATVGAVVTPIVAQRPSATPVTPIVTPPAMPALQQTAHAGDALDHAWAQLASGEFSEALGAFAEAAERDPAAAEPKAGFALASLHLGRHRAAAWAMRRAFSVADTPDTWDWLAEHPQAAAELLDQATASAEASRALDADDRRFLRGAVALLAGQTDEAIRVAEQAGESGDRHASVAALASAARAEASESDQNPIKDRAVAAIVVR
ncbi:MAG: hypothetical protein AAGI30_04845 [Planctomycetota bacterium]